MSCATQGRGGICILLPELYTGSELSHQNPGQQEQGPALTVGMVRTMDQGPRSPSLALG